jgi:hypothetical protein
MASATKDVNAAKDNKKPVVLPAPNSDFYPVTECLNVQCACQKNTHTSC